MFWITMEQALVAIRWLVLFKVFLKLKKIYY